jgi:hypothetical protein
MALSQHARTSIVCIRHAIVSRFPFNRGRVHLCGEVPCRWVGQMHPSPHRIRHHPTWMPRGVGTPRQLSVSIIVLTDHIVNHKCVSYAFWNCQATCIFDGMELLRTSHRSRLFAAWPGEEDDGELQGDSFAPRRLVPPVQCPTECRPGVTSRTASALRLPC